MNLKKLEGSVGQRLRLRPPPTRWEGPECVVVDTVWTLSAVKDATVLLTNEGTHQSLCLSPDHIHSYTTSPPGNPSFEGFLELKVTVDLTRGTPTIDIIPSGAARTLARQSRPPLLIRIRAAFDRINPEINAAFDSGTPAVAVMISLGNLQELQVLLKETGGSKIARLEFNGNVAMGRGARIGGHIHDLEEGSQQGFRVFRGPAWSEP